MNANSTSPTLRALQDVLRELLNATHTLSNATREPTEVQASQNSYRARQVQSQRQNQHPAHSDPNSDSDFSIVVISRSISASLSNHWAIAVVTNEHSRQCRVFHVSDTHVMGLRALGWSAFVQDEIVDRTSGYRGGVRIGLVRREELRRFEEVRPSPAWSASR